MAAAVTARIWPCVMLQWEWLGGTRIRRAAIIGAGCWGTALAVCLARAGFEVDLGCRTEEQGKIDKNSHLLWFRKIVCHHDLDLDSNGNVYTITSKLEKDTGMIIDSITILSPDGSIKKELSLYDLFKKYPDPAFLDRSMR